MISHVTCLGGERITIEGKMEMRYVANVTIAFPAGSTTLNAFDIWESTIVLESESPTQALQQAILVSRTRLDEPGNWRSLGYRTEPCLYAVRSLHTEPDLPRNSVKCNDGCVMLTKVATFNELEMNKIKNFEDVLVPYRVIHLG
jgi:hypothetical protein